MGDGVLVVRDGEVEPTEGRFVRVGRCRWHFNLEPARRGVAVELVVDGVVMASEIVPAGERYDATARNIAGGEGAMVAVPSSEEEIAAAVERVAGKDEAGR